LSNKADGTTDDCTASSFEESDGDTNIEDWHFDDEEHTPSEHYLSAAANLDVARLRQNGIAPESRDGLTG
jgi:hypothetical protein